MTVPVRTTARISPSSCSIVQIEAGVRDRRALVDARLERTIMIA
jgi:hypothetical protein